MFVSKSMTRKVLTADKDESIFTAQERMKKAAIRHLPVVDENDYLIGIVTDRDLRSAMPYSFFKDSSDEAERTKLAEMRIEEIMSKDPITLNPAHTIQDALLMVQEHKVGAFPVVDEANKLRGILSVRDLLHAFVNVLGIGQPGTLMGILAEEKVGQLKQIVDVIAEEGISCGSILVARYWEEDKRAVFPYLLTNHVARIKKKLTGMGFTLIDPMEWYLDQLPPKESSE
jgi:acetoin utilization protein AcuB